MVRTLDAGADKPLPFLTLADEPNPALGVRGFRTARRSPEVLDGQLAAIALAAKDTDASIWVMAPMVTTVAEAAAFAAQARGHGLPTVGVMIEVPAAALRSGRSCAVVDFLSIGTNDLSQYTMAADREGGDLADLLDPWQPALLSLIAACGAAGPGGRQTGRRLRRGGRRPAARAGAGRPRHHQPVDVVARAGGRGGGTGRDEPGRLRAGGRGGARRERSGVSAGRGAQRPRLGDGQTTRIGLPSSHATTLPTVSS